MLVTELSVRKMDKSDPRYPDNHPGRTVADVYLCEFTLDDGQKFEIPSFVFVEGTGMYPTFNLEHAEAMLMQFGKAIGRLDLAQKAA